MGFHDGNKAIACRGRDSILVFYVLRREAQSGPLGGMSEDVQVVVPPEGSGSMPQQAKGLLHDPEAVVGITRLEQGFCGDAHRACDALGVAGGLKVPRRAVYFTHSIVHTKAPQEDHAAIPMRPREQERCAIG